MIQPVELSEFEKIRLENIRQHKEEFDRLFPESILFTSIAKKTTEPRTKRKNSVKLDVAPRKSLSRSCKRKIDDSDEDSIENSDSENTSPHRSGIRFGSWGKIQERKAKDKGEEYFKDFVDNHHEQRKKRFVALEPGRIEDVAETTSEKVYNGEYGTTCHQCRQKTLDTKTTCKNEKCFGIRGRFCGPCLRNRYGEDVKEAILSAEWFCPPCRGICNCSFCMKKRGRGATGIMIHVAKKRGYTDVKTFLGLSTNK